MANLPAKVLWIIGVFALGILSTASQALSQAATDVAASTNRSDSQITSRDSYKLDRGVNEYGIWGGGSFDSPTVIGTAEDRKFLTLGLRYGRIFGTTKRVAFEYTADAVPLAIVFQPDFARAFNRRPDHTVYGAGISPIGFRFIFNRGGRIKPFASTSGGFLYFRRPVPNDVALATRFNFTFEFSGGLQIFTRSRRAVTIGYKLQHISNGGRSSVNPGLDANVIYVGFSLFR